MWESSSLKFLISLEFIQQIMVSKDMVGGARILGTISHL